MDLSGIRTEEELDAAAALMLPASERAKLAWTGMFDASGRTLTDSGGGEENGSGRGAPLRARPTPDADDELAEYEWTADSGYPSDAVDVGVDSAALRGTAAAGTAQLFSLWARAAQQAHAAEDDDESGQGQGGEEGDGATQGSKVPSPEPLTTDTAMSAWATLRETLGLGAAQGGTATGPPPGAGIRLRIHPSGRRLRFDLNGRLVKPGWEVGAGGVDVTPLAIAAGLHHHGQEPHEAGYSLIEILGLARSSAVGQRALAMRMLAGVLEGRRAAWLGVRPPSSSPAHQPWGYAHEEWGAEAAVLRGLLLPPALPVLLQLALRDTSAAVLRPSLAAMRAFVCGLPPEEEEEEEEGARASHARPPTIRPQPPVDEEGDAGRLADGYAPDQLASTILRGVGARSVHEPGAVQALRVGRAALVDPVGVMTRGEHGMLHQCARISESMAGDSGALAAQHVGMVVDVLRILLACARRSLSLATTLARSLTLNVSTTGKGVKTSVGLLPWLVHACVYQQGAALRSGSAGAEVTLAAVLVVRLVSAVVTQGRGLAEELCDIPGVGRGLGKGAPPGSTLALSPVQLDGLLQFLPLVGTRAPPTLQLELLRLLTVCTEYGMGLDRVSTLWNPHLEVALAAAAGPEVHDGAASTDLPAAVQVQVVRLVGSVARQAALVAHLAAQARVESEKAGDGGTQADPGKQEAEADAMCLCQQACTMVSAVLSCSAVSTVLTLPPAGSSDSFTAEVAAHGAGLELLTAYLALGRSTQVGLLPPEGPTPASPHPSAAALPVLDDLLVLAGAREEATARLVAQWLLPSLMDGTWVHLAASATSKGDTGSVDWQSGWARLAGVLFDLHPESCAPLTSAVSDLPATLLATAVGIAHRAHVVREEAERACPIPAVWWSACDPAGAGVGHTRSCSYAGVALLGLALRLHGRASRECAPAATEVLSLLQPGDEGLALQVLCDVLLHVSCLSVSAAPLPGAGRSHDVDALGIRAGLLPAWASALCRSHLLPNIGGDEASWPRPARLSVQRCAVQRPGLLFPGRRTGWGSEDGAVDMEAGVHWTPLPQPESGGGEGESSDSVATLCVSLPRPLRVAPGLPTSCPTLVRVALACPLALLGVMDKLRTSGSGSTLHANVPLAPDPQEAAVILRPVRAAVAFVCATHAHALFGFTTASSLRTGGARGSSEGEHALRLARTALSAATLLFTLVHAPLAELDDATGQGLLTAFLDVHALFRSCSPGASPVDVWSYHPALGAGVLQALLHATVDMLVGDGPGTRGGSAELALYALLLPAWSPSPPRPDHGAPPPVGEGEGQGTTATTTYLRAAAWRALATSGLGHVLGAGVSTPSPGAASPGVASFAADLASPPACTVEEEEEEVLALATLLTCDTTTAAAANGHLPVLGPPVSVEERGRRAGLVGWAATLEAGAGEVDEAQRGGLPTFYALAVAAMARAVWGTGDTARAKLVWGMAALSGAHPRVCVDVLGAPV